MAKLNLISPEAVIMITIAIFLDIFGILCAVLIAVFGIGAILSYIPDFMGIVIFGTWAFMRNQTKGASGGMEEAKSKIAKKKKKELTKTAGKGSKAITKALGRIGLGALIEIIPVIGAAPGWTIVVILELKS